MHKKVKDQLYIEQSEKLRKKVIDFVEEEKWTDVEFLGWLLCVTSTYLGNSSCTEEYIEEVLERFMFDTMDYHSNREEK